ncbi:MAG: peptide chain release factor N(5)-glutamine methyltransferase [Lachnospiraceae bacterium]|nr:peptide chain release factor N(5)-glutamine methyltransferase [Lachnospiraceae bacterium]
MTYRKAFSLGESVLEKANIADAKNDAWLLLAMACKVDHTFYYMHVDEEMPEEQAHEYEVLIRKRAEHVPLQYITGEQEFMGLNFNVNSNVLIPRQDTETLVEEALKVAKPGMKILDMCTGSGCVLISIMKNVHGVEGFGYDISKQAINVAKDNAKLNDVSAVFERSNLFEDVMDEHFDMIVSNPPYIKTAEIAELMPEVAEFEPIEALDGKEDGLYFYREIIEKCVDYLTDEGYLLFEIGYDQADDVSAMLKNAGFLDVRVQKDLAGNDRVVMGQL